MSVNYFERDARRRIKTLEDAVERLRREAGPNLPFQVLGDNKPFFGAGYHIGGGGNLEVYEPPNIPAPTGLVLSWGSSFDTIYIDASWVAPTSYGGTAIQGYTVQVLKSGSSIPQEAPVASGATRTRVEPVEPNTTYTVTVFGLSANGRNGLSLSGTITTGGDTTAPVAPTFPATPVSPAILGLIVKWNANAERDVANGAGQYRVVVSVNSSLSSPVVDTKVGGTSLFVTGLIGGQAYYVGVYAIDSSGNSSPVAKPTGAPWTALANVTDTSALAIGGGNTVKDSSFEGTGWTVASGTWSQPAEGRGIFGPLAAKVTGTSDAWIQQDVSVTAGTWILSSWSQASAVTIPSGSSGQGVTMYASMLSGPALSNISAVMGGTLVGARLVAGIGTWSYKRLAIKFDVPSGGGTLRIFLQRGNGGTANGSAWFDDVQLEQGNVLTAYAPRADEILPNTIKTPMIADDGITTPKLAANAAVFGKVAAGAIGVDQVIVRSLTGDRMVVGTLTGTEINGQTITGDKLVANFGIQTSGYVQSTGFVSGSTGWRISGDGGAELNLATIRGGAFVGGGIVAGGYIQSANYSSATAGWRIDSAGNAELNNAQIRGVLNAATFASSIFDFMSPAGGGIALRIATGAVPSLQFGQSMVNTGSGFGFDPVLNRMLFNGYIANSGYATFKFVNGFVEFDNARSTGGYSLEPFEDGGTQGYFIGSPSFSGSQPPWDPAWGMQIEQRGGLFNVFTQGVLDSTARHVGLRNTFDGTEQVYIDYAGGTRSLTRTGWITFSDERAKTGIKPLTRGKKDTAGAAIRALRPIRYKLKKDGRLACEHLGLSAAEVRDTLPEAVHENVKFHEDDPDDMLGISYDTFIPVLIKHNQELHDEIDSLQARLLVLEKRRRT